MNRDACVVESPFFFDRRHDLLHDLRMKDLTRVKWDDNPTRSFYVDPMAAFGPEKDETRVKEHLLCIPSGQYGLLSQLRLLRMS